LSIYQNKYLKRFSQKQKILMWIAGFQSLTLKMQIF